MIKELEVNHVKMFVLKDFMDLTINMVLKFVLKNVQIIFMVKMDNVMNVQ